MIVISNTSPLNYLILIQFVEVLPQLFEKITIPRAVYRELSDSAAPMAVQTWIVNPPDWLSIKSVERSPDARVNLLDPGEREAILLAQEIGADLLLLDDMKARRIATERGVAIAGILGILDRAATRQLLDLPTAVRSLQNTSFWVSDHLYQKLLDKHS